jgi:hypothetical protein
MSQERGITWILSALFAAPAFSNSIVTLLPLVPERPSASFAAPLPRSGYTLVDPPAETQSSQQKLKMNEYEAVLAVYQAQNAVQIAKAAGADRHAKETLDKAEQLFRQAEAQWLSKADWKETVTTARQATQAAEDARTITTRRMEADSQGSRGTLP